MSEDANKTGYTVNEPQEGAYSLVNVGNETISPEEVVSMKPKLVINKDFEWFQKNFGDLKKKYSNQWIAVANQSVVSSGDTFIGALTSARDKGYKRPLVTKVSPEGWGQK